MDKQLADRLEKVLSSVYDMEPLDDDGEETPLAMEVLDLLMMLEVMQKEGI